MLRRLLLLGVRSYTKGPAKSWIYSSAALMAYNAVRKMTGRREVIDISSIRPGETIIIEHLEISHAEQMKQMKKQRRQDKREAKRDAKRRRKSDASD